MSNNFLVWQLEHLKYSGSFLINTVIVLPEFCQWYKILRYGRIKIYLSFKRQYLEDSILGALCVFYVPWMSESR